VSLPGLRRSVRPEGPRPLVIRVAELEPARAAGGVCIGHTFDTSGRPTVVISQVDDGYRMDVEDAGAYWLASDGTEVICAPRAPGSWSWRRYLMGQVMPFAALLQGLEVFHASGIELDGEAVVLSGGTGVGKSTLALNLHLAGAGFVADDVVAVELCDGELVVHPGLRNVKVRRSAAGLVESRGLAPPATVDAEELRFIVNAVPEPLPLGTFCALELSPDGSLSVEPLVNSARRLLASTFNLVITTPERLASQLEICAAIGHRARALRVRVPDRPDVEVAAELRNLLDRAGDSLSAA
jgi:hypothetical protein